MLRKELKDKLLLITYAIVLFVCLMNYSWIGDILKNLFKLLLPFIIGGIVAFILNVLVKMIEDSLLKKMKKGKRATSVILSLGFIIGFIAIILFILIPQIHNASQIFIENIPEYQQNIYNLGKKIGLSEEELEFVNLENNKLRNEITNLISKNSKSIINASMGFANSVFSAVCDFFIGLVFAIYILFDKERLTRQIKKLLKKICNSKVYNFIVDLGHMSYLSFSNFIKVQVFEACVLGSLCFAGMVIIGLPYAATVSVLVGVTALIPIFGAFIGCIIAAFLIFMVSPLESVIFVIFFIILQQIETNFIYPRVVGGKVGLPGIWVFVAVVIGGSIGGVFGMLFGVPVMSVIYTLLKNYVNKKEEVRSS